MRSTALRSALLSLSLLGSTAVAAGLDDNALPAAGAQSTLLSADTIGRWAVEARSEGGTTLQIVDRMTGPGARAGRVGSEDGRVDLFMERGTVKVLTEGPTNAEGSVQLTAVPFEERNTSAKRLVPSREVQTTLSDKQQRSWWIVNTQPRRVDLVISGRYLETFRLWNDGQWLHDAQPTCRTEAPVEGQPWQRCTLSVELPTGSWQVSAYGGQGSPWAVAGDGAPLTAQWDLPRLPSTGRQPVTIGPSGVASFRVSGAKRIIAELPSLAPLSLTTASPGDPWRGSRVTLSEDARTPILSTSLSGSEQIVHLHAAPGTVVTVQTLTPIRTAHTLKGSGKPEYIATVTSGSTGDSAPTTAVLVNDKRAVDTRVLELGDDKRLEDTFNLHDEVSLFLHADKPGTFRFSLEGVTATLQLEPFLLGDPRDMVPEPPVEGTLERELSAGLYRLTLRPTNGGVAKLTVAPSTWSSWAMGLVGMDLSAASALSRPGLRWDSLTIPYKESRRLERGQIGDATVGIVQRALPIDLTEGLPIPLAAGEQITLPVFAASRGRIALTDDRGAPLALKRPGTDWSAELDTQPERFDLTVHNPTDKPVQAVLSFRAWEVLPDVPLPSLSDLRSRPQLSLPALTSTSPAYLEMGPNEPGAWVVDVKEPALYRVHSTGLLATEGRIRSRVTTSLASASANGDGRNFEVARYLRSGEYILEANTLGRSQGHLGVHLSALPVNLGGELAAGDTARTTIPPGESFRVDLLGDEDRTYKLEVFAANGSPRCRFEDAEGWPIMSPEVTCEQTLRLPDGKASVTLLPTPEGGRRVVRFTELTDPPSYAGHGPHPLPREQRVDHTWREPALGEERVPDVWTVEWPATTQATLSLPDNMVATVRSADGTSLGRTVPGEAWTKALAAGTYTIEAMALQRDDYLPYAITIAPAALVDGSVRRVSLPANLSIAVDRATPIIVETIGSVDVRASLQTGSGEVRVDDAPDDWNARIVTRVTEGTHELRLEAVDGGRVTTVSVRVPKERTDPALSTAELRQVAPGRDAVIVPLNLPQRGELVQIQASSAQAVGIALEQSDGDAWLVVDEQVGRAPVLAARRLDDAKLRLRVWTLDGRPDPVEVEAFLSEGRTVRPEALAKGTRASNRRDGPLDALLTEGKAGVWRVSGADVRVCPAPGMRCHSMDAPTVAVTDDLWLLTAGSAKASRVAVDQSPTPVPLPAGQVVDVDLAGDNLSLLRVDGGLSPVDAPDLLRTFSGSHTWVLADGGRRQLVTDTRAMVRLSAIPLSELSAMPLDWGVHTVALPAKSAQPYDLPRKRDRDLTLSLPQGLAAVVTTSDGVSRLLASIDGAQSYTVPAAGERLLLVNPGTEPAMAAVSLTPDEPRRALAEGVPLERVFASAGTLVVPVAAVGKLHTDATSATFLGDDGGLAHGTHLTTASAGVWLLAHEPGALHAWVGEAPSREDKAAAQHLITGADRVALAGARTDLQFRLPGPALVRWSAPVDAVINGSDGTHSRTTTTTGDAGVDLWLPNGTGTMSARAPGSKLLSGHATVQVITSQLAGEGLGKPAIVSPTAPAIYHFDVTRSGTVGIGVRADSDGVRTRLLSAEGALLAEGSAAMPTLEPGRYWLVLDVPAHARPVQARPALVGLDRPPTDPPAEVVQRYLALAGLIPEESP